MRLITMKKRVMPKPAAMSTTSSLREAKPLIASVPSTDIDTEMGKFYDVTGSSTQRINARPGLLTTTNPFYFQSNWTERINDHYILHDAFLISLVCPAPGGG